MSEFTTASEARRCYLTAVNADYGYINLGNGNPNRFVVLGSGTTPPTIEDYKLDSPIWDGTYAVSAVEFDYGVTLNCTWINTTDEPVTVGEIGLLLCVEDRDNKRSAALLTRSTFNPITIPVNGSRTFSINLNFENLLGFSTNTNGDTNVN